MRCGNNTATQKRMTPPAAPKDIFNVSNID
jgi:hypothetical protein